MESGPGSQIARRRLCAAVVVSLLAHAWFLAALPQARQPRLGAVLTIDARIPTSASVFRASLGEPILERPVVQEPDAPRSIKEVRAAKVAAGDPKPSRAEEPAALPQASDPNWYGAHELDTYPRALAPLQFDAGRPGRAGARLLLWLRIDEMGRIIDVTAGETGVPADLLEAARASLAAVAFAPARKDERAVKSRIQVSLAY